jgi:hypothetical protein
LMKKIVMHIDCWKFEFVGVENMVYYSHSYDYFSYLD